jgi:hemolysin-activating ACP:hemolysin acyltransferase
MRALIALLASSIWILGTVYHLWTVVIAFQHGFVSGIVTLVLPVLSQIYWFFKLWGVNTTYIVVSIVYTIIVFIVSIFRND